MSSTESKSYQNTDSDTESVSSSNSEFELEHYSEDDCRDNYPVIEMKDAVVGKLFKICEGLINEIFTDIIRHVLINDIYPVIRWEMQRKTPYKIIYEKIKKIAKQSVCNQMSPYGNDDVDSKIIEVMMIPKSENYLVTIILNRAVVYIICLIPSTTRIKNFDHRDCKNHYDRKNNQDIDTSKCTHAQQFMENIIHITSASRKMEMVNKFSEKFEQYDGLLSILINKYITT